MYGKNANKSNKSFKNNEKYCIFATETSRAVKSAPTEHDSHGGQAMWKNY